jgi:hypothetical protein
MAETLGKMEKPEAESFKLGRKLIFVPLIFLPPQDEDAGLVKLVDDYWKEASAQVNKLAGGLGGVAKVFHELIPGGEAGLNAIRELRSGSYDLVKEITSGGAVLEETEEPETLAEFMDWSRCLSVRLDSPKVFTEVYEKYTQAQQKRTETIAKRLDDSLKTDELGLVLLRDGHRVQFPADVQVFYVAPPALDALTRYVRERLERAMPAEEPGEKSPEHPAP